MAYQPMATPYDQQPQASSSLIQIFTGVSLQASKGWLTIKSNPAQPYFGGWNSANEDHFSAEMANFLVQHYASLPVSLHPLKLPCCTNVYLCTEYKQAGAIFCGHANYHSMGPWYNWVMLRWAREDNQCYAGDVDCQVAYGDDEATALEHLYAPGKILGSVSAKLADWDKETESASKGEMMAVVSTCDFSHSRELVFSTKWQQSYVYHASNPKSPNIQLVDVTAIVRHCLMVPHNAGHSSYHEIWSKELWGNELNDCS
jgi:hypothetical protein